MAEPVPIRLSCNGPVVRLTLFFITLLAFILSCHAAASCAFLIAEHEFYGDGDNGQLLVTGLYRTNGGDSTRACTSVDYLRDVETKENGDAFDFPDAFKAARAFAVLAPVIGSLALVLFVLSLITERFNNKIWFKFVIPGLLISASVLQLLTFSAFGIDQCTDLERELQTFLGKCIFAEGANAALAAMILYFLPALPMLCCIHTARHPVLVLYKDSATSVGSTTAAQSRPQEQVPLKDARPTIEEHDSDSDSDAHMNDSDAHMYIEDDENVDEERPTEAKHSRDP